MYANLSAFLLFALVAGFTPGPNNLMLATSGVNFGLRRTLPHLLGVICGYPVLFAAAGTGLGGIFLQFPALKLALTIIGSIYLLWLAWRIAFASATLQGNANARPLTFLQAAAFQWVNPKGWMMAITAIGLYASTGEGYFSQVLAMTAVAMLVTLASASTWALFGLGIRGVFEHRPRLLRAFNMLMGVLLVLSLLPMLLMEPADAAVGAPSAAVGSPAAAAHARALPSP